jgi:hypothetical protein
MFVSRAVLIAVSLHAATVLARPTNDIGDVRASLYCLSHSRFGFENPKSLEFRIRYVFDEKSFEGERRLVLAVEGASNGIRLYDIKVVPTVDRQYRLANNTDLQKRNGDYQFTNPPVGGIASQARLKRAFEMIKGKPHETIKAASIGASPMRCRSFDYGS